MTHARCATCDRRLTDYDRRTMQSINDEHRLWTGENTYDLGTEDGTTDLYCADCLDGQAEAAQERSDADYYGGSSPTLADQMESARRLK